MEGNILPNMDIRSEITMQSRSLLHEITIQWSQIYNEHYRNDPQGSCYSSRDLTVFPWLRPRFQLLVFHASNLSPTCWRPEIDQIQDSNYSTQQCASTLPTNEFNSTIPPGISEVIRNRDNHSSSRAQTVLNSQKWYNDCERDKYHVPWRFFDAWKLENQSKILIQNLPFFQKPVGTVLVAE